METIANFLRQAISAESSTWLAILGFGGAVGIVQRQLIFKFAGGVWLLGGAFGVMAMLAHMAVGEELAMGSITPTTATVGTMFMLATGWIILSTWRRKEREKAEAFARMLSELEGRSGPKQTK